MGWSRFITFNVISILVGVAGFLSAIVTMFVNISQEASVKWLLLTIWLCLTCVVVLLKIIHDLNREESIAIKSYEVPIGLQQDSNVLIIRKNPFFASNSLVGCYWVENEVETISFLGLVHHVQDNLIQVKLLKKVGSKDASNIFVKSAMKKLVIRPVIPFDALSDFEIEGEL